MLLLPVLPTFSKINISNNFHRLLSSEISAQTWYFATWTVHTDISAAAVVKVSANRLKNLIFQVSAITLVLLCASGSPVVRVTHIKKTTTIFQIILR